LVIGKGQGRVDGHDKNKLNLKQILTNKFTRRQYSSGPTFDSLPIGTEKASPVLTVNYYKASRYKG